MTMISFYHLETSTIEKALPRLLEKVYQSHKPARFKLKSDEEVVRWDGLLWTYTTKYFLPHGSITGGNEARQPIYLTASNDNPNNAKILITIDPAELEQLEGYDRCVFMFDGTDTEVIKSARQQWKRYKESGFSLTYYQQTSKGGWEEKAVG